MKNIHIALSIAFIVIILLATIALIDQLFINALHVTGGLLGGFKFSQNRMGYEGIEQFSIKNYPGLEKGGNYGK